MTNPYFEAAAITPEDMERVKREGQYLTTLEAADLGEAFDVFQYNGMLVFDTVEPLPEPEEETCCGYGCCDEQKEVARQYEPSIGPFGFAEALNLLKDGALIAREGWNGKGMFLYLVNGSNFRVTREPLLGIYEEGTPIEYRAHIDMKTADGSCVPWVASQTDLLAHDWFLVESAW